MAKTTIKDIAAILNTSTKTVSKALNDKHGVSEELRYKIKKKAKELNYVPNIFGRGLSGRSLRTIGIIISDNANSAYSLIIKGLEKKAAEANYNIILCNSNEETELQDKFMQILIEKNVDGIIMNPSYFSDESNSIDKLKQFEIPYIFMNRTIRNEENNCIKVDSVLGAYLATQYLIKKGHTKIIYLTCKSTTSVVRDRIEGYKKALIENNLPIEERNIYKRCDASIEDGYNEMLQILRKRKDFTAVFAFNDTLALGAIKAMYECRLRIPSDIAVMGFDNIPFSDVSLIPLTTVNQDLYAIGATAMEELLNKINKKECKKLLEIPRPYIVERNSV